MSQSNKAKHTPGPWSVESRDLGPDGRWNIAVASDGRILTEYLDPADAHLIAAAPELLEIAVAYRNLLKTSASTEGQVRTYEHIQAILAKVEGAL